MTLPAPQTTAARRTFYSLKVDMTPMVDLGFLLITFFVFTATLSQPGATKLVMPKEGANTPVAQRNALTCLLGKDKIHVYEGRWEDAVANSTITSTNYSLVQGIGNRIRQKQKKLQTKNDLVVLIKPLPEATYQRIIAALDEMGINQVQKYALVDPTPEEKLFVQKH